MSSIIPVKEYVLRKCRLAKALPRNVRSFVSRKDAEFHEYLYTKWPKTIRMGGEVLRMFYGIIVAPAFAVVLALLLVGLVISGRVTVIVSICVISAWFVASISVAKIEWVNRQRIGRRLTIVILSAAMMGIGANHYVKWCLINYAHSQQKKPESNTDQVAYDRLKELFEQELHKLPTSPAPLPKIKESETKPDISIHLYNPKSFIIEFQNKSNVLISSAKWWEGFINIDRSRLTQATTLPISGGALDFIRPHDAIGGMLIFDNRIQPPLRDGERIFGFIGVTCPNCVKTRTYFVYAVFGQGGWYTEMPMSQISAVAGQPFFNILNDPDAAFASIPNSVRIPVTMQQ